MCVNAWRYFKPKAASILQISFSERQLYFFHKYTIGFAKFQSTKSFNIQMIDFFPTANYGFACNFFPWLPKNLINLLIGTIEFYEFPNSQVQSYVDGLYQFFALTGFIFSHIMLAWPFYDLPCSTFFRLSSASERILKMTTFSDKYQQRANHSKIFFCLNFFLIEAENRESV